MAQGLVTVFGGSGLLGHALVGKLARVGWRVRVAVRDVEAAKSLQPLGTVGQIVFLPTDVCRPDTVRRALRGADAAVNLVGVLRPRGKNTFRAIHAAAAGSIAQIAAQERVASLVHVSAIGADGESPSAYARSKAEGEKNVRDALPDAVVVRPSVLFGPGDRFYAAFAALTRTLPFLPVFSDSRHGKDGIALQPVYVGDVAEAIARILADPQKAGLTFELGGPHVLTLRQIMEQVAHETRRPLAIRTVSLLWARVASLLLLLLSMDGPDVPLTPDMVVQLGLDNVASGRFPGLADLAVVPTPTSAILPLYLNQFRPMDRMMRRLNGRAV